MTRSGWGTSVDMALCLVTGATGYIGGRLAPELLAAGHDVRCMVRSAGRLRDLPWAARTEVVEADATDPVQRAARPLGVGGVQIGRAHV